MYELFNHQDEFLYSTKRHTGLVGGFRSGKSFVGTLKTVSKKLSYPSINVAYYLPTVSLIKDIAFDRFGELLDNQNVNYSLNQSDKTFYTDYGNIYLRSMDNPAYIIGYEVGYSLIDEVDVVHPNKIKTAFKNILARNSARLPDGSAPQLDFVSTPEGFGFLYNFFVKNPSSNKLLIKARTKDNKTITSDYIESLQDEYSPEQLEAYLNGEFVNLTSGTVYNEFDRKLHATDRTVQANDRLFIGMDFNISQMAAIVFVLDGNDPRAVYEFSNVYDTQTMCNLIQQTFPNNPKIVYPDASGQNRHSSGKSDVVILKENGFHVIVPSKNPFVKDRVNTVNKLLRDKRLLVNSVTCPLFTEALEQQAYDKAGVPDKSTGHDHLNDAGGYPMCELYGQNRGRIVV